MSGYDNKLGPSINLMKGRLGVYERQQSSADGGMSADYMSLGALDNGSTILTYDGGHFQQDRMIRDKRRSLNKALKYSYQAATIEKVDDSAVPWSFGGQETQQTIRALINPNKLKMDYDDKIVSVPSEWGFKTGDVFNWTGTNTYWLIYLQDLTETAYFRGDIRRCRYILKFPTKDGYKEVYAAIRGPVETKINFIQKAGVSVDVPNHSLNILMPKTPETIEYFTRYSKFYLSSSDDTGDYKDRTCWRVEAHDWISTPGILEITAIEYYANETEDDIENGLVGTHIAEPESPNNGWVDNRIVGESFIKPQGIYTYTYNGFGGKKWQIDTEKYPVQFSVNPNDDRQVRLQWTGAFSGQFEISYNGTTKVIVVESLY